MVQVRSQLMGDLHFLETRLADAKAYQDSFEKYTLPIGWLAETFSDSKKYHLTGDKDLELARKSLEEAKQQLQAKDVEASLDQTARFLQNANTYLNNVYAYRRMVAERSQETAEHGKEDAGAIAFLSGSMVVSGLIVGAGPALLAGGLIIGGLFVVSYFVGDKKIAMATTETKTGLTEKEMIAKAQRWLLEWHTDHNVDHPVSHFAIEANLATSLPSELATFYREELYRRLTAEAKEETKDFGPKTDEETKINTILQAIQDSYRVFYDGENADVKSCVEQRACNCNGERDLFFLKQEFAGLKNDPKYPYGIQSFTDHGPAVKYNPATKKVWDLRDGTVKDQIPAVYDWHLLLDAFLKKRGAYSPIADVDELLLAPDRGEGPSAKPSEPSASPTDKMYEFPPARVAYSDDDTVPKYYLNPKNSYLWHAPQSLPPSSPSSPEPSADQNYQTEMKKHLSRSYKELSVEDWRRPLPVNNRSEIPLPFKAEENNYYCKVAFLSPEASRFYNESIQSFDSWEEYEYFGLRFFLKLGRDSLTRYEDPRLMQEALADIERLASFQKPVNLERVADFLYNVGRVLFYIPIATQRCFRLDHTSIFGGECGEEQKKWEWDKTPPDYTEFVLEAHCFVKFNPLWERFYIAGFHQLPQALFNDPARFLSFYSSLPVKDRRALLKIIGAQYKPLLESMVEWFKDPQHVEVVNADTNRGEGLELEIIPDRKTDSPSNDDSAMVSPFQRAGKARMTPEAFLEFLVFYATFVEGRMLDWNWNPAYTQVILGHETPEQFDGFIGSNFSQILEAYPRATWTTKNPLLLHQNEMDLLFQHGSTEPLLTIFNHPLLPPDLAQLAEKTFERQIKKLKTTP